MKMKKEKIFFVYNANTGLKNSIIDGIHKIVSPSTYSCNLCAITHGYFTQKSEMKRLLETLEQEVEFYYKDEWEKKYDRKDTYPVILREENDLISIFITTEELNGMNLLDLTEKFKSLKS